MEPTQPPVQWVSGFFPGDKAAGRNVNHSPAYNPEVKNYWSYISTPPIRLYEVRETF